MTARARALSLLAGAGALALALVLYAALAMNAGDEKAAAARAASERLVAPLAQPDGGTVLVRYDHLLITTRGQTTELGRVPDGAWVIFRPARARADTRVAEDVVSTLQSARLNRIIEEHPQEADLVRYGLQPPRFTVTASADGVPSLTLKGGVENAFDGSVYVQRTGDERVYALDGATRTTLDLDTDQLRARDLVGVRDLGLLGIQLKSARHDWALTRQPEQPWVFVRPAGAPPDGAAISQWVSGLAPLRAPTFLADSPQERKRTGVEKPAVDVTFRRKDETVRVRLAAGKQDGDPAIVLREDAFGATLAEVPRSALAALDVPPAELRDRRVLAFQPSQVDRIRFLPAGGGPAVVVQRQHADGGPSEIWLLVSRVPGPASTAKVGTLLYALASLRSLPVDDAPPKDPGLGASARTVVLEDRTGQVVATLVLGSAVPRKDQTVWTRNSRGDVVQIDLGRLGALPARAEDLIEMARPALPADSGR